jgi:sulfite oxidase
MSIPIGRYPAAELLDKIDVGHGENLQPGSANVEERSLDESSMLLPASSDRREFLKATSAAVAAAMLSRRGLAADESARADALVQGKDPRLVVHAAKPNVMETPAELLLEKQITPTPLVFIRNNQQLPKSETVQPIPPQGWQIEVGGLVDRPRSIDAAELTQIALVEREMVLQCSGNGRSLFAESAPVKGTPWGRGGMANVVFAGVPLAAVVKRLSLRINSEAKFLTAEGKDEPAATDQDFEHSIPLDEAIEKSILALQMNGQPLPAIHGGPVRLVTPGYYGTMHVKWLGRLRFETGESEHTSQVPHYRTPRRPIKPGERFQATLANSEPNWRMKIKSVVLTPAPGAKLATCEVRVAGVAFNDGEARIREVLISSDQGRTWTPAEIETPESPYAWYRWQAHLSLPPGAHQIWARAIDTLGRGQPLDGSIGWNPQGYAWNGVEKIDVTVG